MSHNKTAQSVRERKEKHPELYCKYCLWYIGRGDECPRHTPTKVLTTILETDSL